MASKTKMPWGLIGHPWLPIPPMEQDLWVALTKIKVEEIKVKHFHSSFLLYKT